MTILQCTSLSKHYGRGEELVKALEVVSLSLEQGSFTAITGPSGSGKSTLLHMLGGLDRPTEGSVQFRDKDLYRLRDDQLAILRRRQFGFVFQSYNLVRELTGMENILLPLMLDKRSPDEAYLNRLIDILGIGSRRNHLPSAMSGGQQQRFAIADQNGELLVALQNPPAPLTVGSVEAFLNDFLPSHPEASVDYIHGSSTAMALASRPGQKAAAILLPDLAKADLFKGVVLGGVLPRKTFSMGHAEEKRYYNECRAID